MSHERSFDPDPCVEAAIARVLEAERAARDALVEAEREATIRSEAARAAVRTLDARTEVRVGRIRATFAARADALVAVLDAQDVELEPPRDQSDAEARALRAAVAVVAGALTGRASGTEVSAARPDALATDRS